MNLPMKHFTGKVLNGFCGLFTHVQVFGVIGMNGESVSLLQSHGLDHFNFYRIFYKIAAGYLKSFMIQRQCIGRKYRSRDCLDRNHFNYSKIEYICQEGEPVDGTDFSKPILYQRSSYSQILKQSYPTKTITVIFISALYCGLKYRLHVLF